MDKYGLFVLGIVAGVFIFVVLQFGIMAIYQRGYRDGLGAYTCISGGY